MHQMLFLVDIFMPFVVLRYSILGMDICVAVFELLCQPVQATSVTPRRTPRNGGGGIFTVRRGV